VNNKLTIRSGDIVVFTAAKAGDVVGCGLVLCKRTGAVFTVGNSEFRFVWTSCVRLHKTEPWVTFCALITLV